jgi:hypothetical protein
MSRKCSRIRCSMLQRGRPRLRLKMRRVTLNGAEVIRSEVIGYHETAVSKLQQGFITRSMSDFSFLRHGFCPLGALGGEFLRQNSVQSDFGKRFWTLAKGLMGPVMIRLVLAKVLDCRIQTVASTTKVPGSDCRDAAILGSFSAVE